MVEYKVYQATGFSPIPLDVNRRSYFVEVREDNGELTGRHCMNLDALAGELLQAGERDAMIFPSERAIRIMTPIDVNLLEPLTRKDLVTLCEKMISQSGTLRR